MVFFRFLDKALPGINRRAVYTIIMALFLVPFVLYVGGDIGEDLNIEMEWVQNEIYRQDVALLRSIDGPVLYENLLLGYDAGKPFLFEPFCGTQPNDSRRRVD